MAEAERQLLHDLQFLVLAVNRYSYRVAHSMQASPRDVHAVGVANSPDYRDGLTAGQLGTILGLSRAATTACLDRLQNSGHVSRSRSLPDARKVSVQLTENGREVSTEMFAPLNAAVRQVVESLSPQELNALASSLQQLTTAIDAVVPPSAEGAWKTEE